MGNVLRHEGKELKRWWTNQPKLNTRSGRQTAQRRNVRDDAVLLDRLRKREDLILLREGCIETSGGTREIQKKPPEPRGFSIRDTSWSGGRAG